MTVLQAALVEMNDSALTIDQLDALSRAVPDDTERKDIRLYLQVTCSHYIQFSCDWPIVHGISCRLPQRFPIVAIAFLPRLSPNPVMGYRLLYPAQMMPAVKPTCALPACRSEPAQPSLLASLQSVPQLLDMMHIVKC